MTAPLQLTHPPRQGEAERDIRYTPAWCTEALLDVCPPPTGQPVLDPAAGDGAILRVLRMRGYDVQWCEIREEEAEGLMAIGWGCVGDWLSVRHRPGPWSIVTNPPYSIGPAFMTACHATQPDYCAALLRLNHLGSASWLSLWRKHPPSGLLVLGSRRPSFSADGKTDASEYVWVVWQSGCSVNGMTWMEWR